jgi:hypothetical protein
VTHEEAHRRGFDFFCYPLLCVAISDKAKFTTMGYACFLLTETVHTFTIYYLAHKAEGKLTRREKGWSIR